MSNPVNTGGPAFSVQGTDMLGGSFTRSPGMTLRDWFAGRAMQALAADMDSVTAIADEHGVNSTVLMASLAYGMADAMLAARDATAQAGGSDD